MASKKKLKKELATQPAIDNTGKNNSTQIPVDPFWSFFSGRYAEWLLFFVASFLYIQTINYEYVMDDAIVITDNVFTKQGVAGIPDIFTHDSFYGFFNKAGSDQLVYGGRYRPFTLAMFAVERSLFGSNPLLSHLVNILLFAFTCVLLFRVLKYLLSSVSSLYFTLSVSFITALLFCVHPVHSEVVANIKGRDELMALLGSLSALWYGMKWMENKKASSLLIALLAFCIALFSKENALSLLVWFPAALYIFKKKSMGQSLLQTIPFLAVFIFFFMVRSAILNGAVFSGPDSTELLNNPFLKWENGKMVSFSVTEKLATVFYCLGMYIKLLIFPYPLTHDYYPRQIPIMQLNNIWVIISLLLNITLFTGTIWLALKRHAAGYAGLLYWIALLIVSNLFFPVGTNMGERFTYMPSVGFCLAIAFLLCYISKTKQGSKMPLFFAGIVALLFGLMTVNRNPAWQSNLVLFETDIKTSAESAKLNNALGCEYITRSAGKPESKEKTELINKGIVYLEKAISIHPLLYTAWFNYGNGYFGLGKFEPAIDCYNKALAINPSSTEALRNLAIAYKSLGRQAGEKEGNLEKSITYLNKAYSIEPGDYETLHSLGVAHGMKGEHTVAIDFFTKALAADPTNAVACYHLGIAYQLAGNIEAANTYINKAKQLNPNILQQRKEQK